MPAETLIAPQQALVQPPAIYGSDITFAVNVALVVATVVVTGVGVIVALGAFFGFQQARKMIRKDTERHSRERADEAVKEFLASPAFHKQIKGMVQELLSEHLKNKITVAFTNSEPEGGSDVVSRKWSDRRDD